MRDVYSNLLALSMIAPAVHAATVNGTGFDLQGASGAAFVISTGAIAGDGKFSAKLQESDDGTTWADVDPSQVQTNAPEVLEASKVYKMGYHGFKRHVRPVLTKDSGTSLAASVTAILGPFTRPVA